MEAFSKFSKGLQDFVLGKDYPTDSELGNKSGKTYKQAAAQPRVSSVQQTNLDAQAGKRATRELARKGATGWLGRTVGMLRNNPYAAAATFIANDIWNTPTNKGTLEGMPNVPTTPGIYEAGSGAAPLADRAPKGSVVRMGGKEYSMNDPKQKAAYEAAQKAELDRQRKRSSMADIRGGDGMLSSSERAPAPISTPVTSTPVTSRDTAPPKDPNNTGARGVSMSYSNFMDNIGTGNNINVRNALSGASIPGTVAYGASFPLNGGENPRSFGQSMDASTMVDGRLIPKITINSAQEGAKAAALEDQRQLNIPDTNFGPNQVNLGVAEGAPPSVSAQSRTSENDRLRARAALLGDGNIMDNLRRAEGEMGMISQGGKKFARDPQAENGLREITQDAYRARMGGTDMMQAINDNPIASAAKAKATARLSQSDTPSVTAASYAPQDLENPVVIGQDGKSEIIDNTGALKKAQGRGVGPVVPFEKIPKNLEGAAGERYLRDLDAGKLF